MKKLVYNVLPLVLVGLLSVTCTACAVWVITIPPKVESYDSEGNSKNEYDFQESVYVKGSDFTSGTYNIYVLVDTEWSDAKKIGPPDTMVVSGPVTVSVGANGEIPLTLLWSSAEPGSYDIVVDVNGNMKYDKDEDAIDDSQIKVTAGFFVIPESPVGTIGGLVIFFAGLFIFRKYIKLTNYN